MNQLTDVINAANAADATKLLAVVIALGIVAFSAIGLKLLPIATELVREIPKRINESNKFLLEVKQEVQASNQYNQANANAAGSSAETFSQLASVLTEGQKTLSDNQVQLSVVLEKLTGHFDRSVDVMSNMYDRMGAQSTQMDVLIGTTNATKRVTDDTQASIAKIQETLAGGMVELNKITKTLIDIQRSPQPQNDNLERLMNTAIEEIRGVKTTIAGIYAMPFPKSELPTKKEDEVKT